jgi:hypothetical protein
VTSPSNLTDLALLVKDAVDSALLALPKGYECTVDARLEADMPWGVTVTVRWPEGTEMLSRDKLTSERRRTLLGFPLIKKLPLTSQCWLPLSDEAMDLLKHLQDAAAGACRKYAGEQSLACEVAFDERKLKEERKKILFSMKAIKIQMSSLYGKFGPDPRDLK